MSKLKTNDDEVAHCSNYIAHKNVLSETIIIRKYWNAVIGQRQIHKHFGREGKNYICMRRQRYHSM